MSKHQAEIFVNAMIEAGSNIQAVGREFYVVDEPGDPGDLIAWGRIEAVAAAFPDRGVLKGEIIDYLHKRGRIFSQ